MEVPCCVHLPLHVVARRLLRYAHILLAARLETPKLFGILHARRLKSRHSIQHPSHQLVSGRLHRVLLVLHPQRSPRYSFVE